MSEKIKSEEFPGRYYVKNGKKSIDWIYYCKFRYLGKLYNFRNLTKEFGVRNEKEANSKMEWIKEEARKSIELGLPNPLERKKIKDLKKSKIIEEKTKRTISEHWKYEITNYKNKRKPNTIKQYENFYNNYIEPFLGQKKPSEIKTKDIDKILYETNLKDQTDPYKSLLKRLLRPIMKKALADGEISSSVVEAYKFDLKLIPKRKKISRKTKLSHLEISQKLYKTIPTYISQYKNQREEWQQLMYLQLLCGRRYGELFELTYENLDLENNKINVYADINKTQVDTSFPIPEESKEFLLKIKSGKIFKEISIGSYYMVFQRLKQKALGQELDFDLTAHDVRSLFISTLVALGEDSRKIDYMLDHKQKSEEVVHFYLDLTESSCNRAFEKYWDALRN
jgi:integrase